MTCFEVFLKLVMILIENPFVFVILANGTLLMLFLKVCFESLVIEEVFGAEFAKWMNGDQIIVIIKGANFQVVFKVLSSIGLVFIH